MAITVIASGITIEGELTSDDEVEVSGVLKGRLQSQRPVVIGPGAVVEAEVSGSTVSVAGQLTGNVNATERVDLQAGARLTGDVRAARLTIADGASFKGNVDMDV
ncbi:MAG: polymer-forming cytoskeletal protein [Myxococcales bacterium]|nr:MAG: polymer-forming cytoskeletal protein [Myxococcales bacterium]